MELFTYHIPLATQKFARKKPVGRWHITALTEEFEMAPIHSHSVLPHVMNANNLNFVIALFDGRLARSTRLGYDLTTSHKYL